MAETWREGALAPADIRKVLTEATKARSYPDSDVAHALLAYDLILPELIQYRHGWFRASRFDAGNADLWFDKLEGDVSAVERMINHLDVLQDYPGGRDDGEDLAEQANALAEVVVYAWPRWAMAMYGIEIQCGVSFDEGEECTNPDAQTLTFWSVRAAE